MAHVDFKIASKGRSSGLGLSKESILIYSVIFVLRFVAQAGCLLLQVVQTIHLTLKLLRAVIMRYVSHGFSNADG
jgi:hypothetical protein